MELPPPLSRNPLKALAEKLLLIQAGSVEDALHLLEGSPWPMTQEEVQAVRDYIEELGERPE